jgi:nicotinic acetylcholine receptor
VYVIEFGIDMSDYYQSVEWDVLEIPAQKNIKIYDCCVEQYMDIYFNITIRRKTLFYTVNLIIPCVSISFLSVLVFYLPSDSGEKLTLGISILVALLVFYLLLIDLIPPTSLVIPLLGKYLLFTLILVNLSILLTIFILNLHHRKPSTHKMPFWMKRFIYFFVFLHCKKNKCLRRLYLCLAIEKCLTGLK